MTLAIATSALSYSAAQVIDIDQRCKYDNRTSLLACLPACLIDCLIAHALPVRQIDLKGGNAQALASQQDLLNPGVQSSDSLLTMHKDPFGMV